MTLHLLALLAPALPKLAPSDSFGLPADASVTSRNIDWVWDFMIWVSVLTALGVFVAMAYSAFRTKRAWLDITDFIAPLVPLGLAAGRIGNFINGELWGRVADPTLPWAMIFPHVDQQPRHPSQLYQAGLEGVLLFVILWFFSRSARPRGAVSAAFLIGYGSFRFIAEYFRTPDEGIFGLSDVISMGQWLSLPMILAGVAMFAWSYRSKA